MTTLERIDLATAYVALSNAHRPALILPWFAESARYHSAYVGAFNGRAAIGEMMAGFFARFPDVRWTVSEYRCLADETVEFAFVMQATEAKTGNFIERHGVELIEFTDEGLIARLEVKKP